MLNVVYPEIKEKEELQIKIKDLEEKLAACQAKKSFLEADRNTALKALQHLKSVYDRSVSFILRYKS